MTPTGDYKSELNDLFDELFPIARSITGPAIRASLKIMCKHIPFVLHAIPTGTAVGDWTIPQEWELKRATLKNELGDVIADTQVSNLHVLNFSIPHHEVVTLEELENHLYSLPNLPNAIPYVTSYYEPRWGFCIQHTKRGELASGKYEVNIDSELKDGYLNYATYDLIGESTQVINLATYLCHPSLANNELSGPLSMVYLYKRLAEVQNRRFTYRFVVAPETIGSIAYLHENQDSLKDQMYAGLVLTCLGGDSRNLSFKYSRRHWTGNPSELDEFLEYWSSHDKHITTRVFTPTDGSDERHYCSPHLNLPVLQVARTVYGEYEGYHNSLDTKDFMSIESVINSAEQILEILLAFEKASLRPMSVAKVGEPQLGRRGLYPTLNFAGQKELYESTSTEQYDSLGDFLEILSLADGTRNLGQIGKFLNLPWIRLISLVKILESNHLIVWRD